MRSAKPIGGPIGLSDGQDKLASFLSLIASECGPRSVVYVQSELGKRGSAGFMGMRGMGGGTSERTSPGW